MIVKLSVFFFCFVFYFTISIKSCFFFFTTGILLMNEEVLLEMEFFRLAQYLTKLSNTITSDELFKYIHKINFSKQKLTQTLYYYKELARTNPPLPT